MFRHFSSDGGSLQAPQKLPVIRSTPSSNESINKILNNRWSSNSIRHCQHYWVTDKIERITLCGQSAFSQGMARPPLVTPAGITDGFHATMLGTNLAL